LLERFAQTARLAAWSRTEASITRSDPDVLLRIQAQRLRRLLTHAWRHSPYYREWMRAAGAEPGDIRNAGDLALLPTIDKLEFSSQPERFAAPSWGGRDGITLASSGTCGIRRLLRYDARAVLRALAAGRRQRLALAELIGRESGYREAVFNREGSVGTQLRGFIESRTLIPSRLELHRKILSPALSFPALLEEVNRFQPDVIRGYGSHLGAFFRWLHEGERRFHKPRAITYGADCMPAADRRLIEDELGIPVLSTYQAVEALRIGFECPARRGFHVSIDQVAVRAIKAECGERSELVLTNLTNYATPVINYRLGDLVTFSSDPCPCGRTLPLLTSVDGRADDLVARPGGTWIHALVVIAPLQSAAGVVRVQVEQREMEEFLLRVIWARHAEPAPQELIRRMGALLGPAAQVRVEAVAEIPLTAAGKAKSLISRVPRGAPGAQPGRQGYDSVIPIAE
jgi:phenylacetate-CoA ligase